ncbi:hypothetical protein GLOIN_2v1815633 [Rhizophagus irregularis DAOM 181602=DAOM 197198]|nr:hypothetical protein GLOIN_2v1815633 [Rhizophagus irregularis DAOM 181602=DAOM 197198]
MEWYETWRVDYENHKLRHDENIGNIDIDELRGENITCEICYPTRDTPEVFKKFWKILQKFEYTIKDYNAETIRALLNLLSIDSEERNNYTKGRTRDALDVIVESIRYLKQPVLREKGLKIIIIVIVRDCIENDKEDETMDRLIGNEELIRYGYILEDWDVNIRFREFYEWHKVAISEFIEWKDSVIRKYKDILYEEAELKEDESTEKIEAFKQKIRSMLNTMYVKGRGGGISKVVIERVYDKIRGFEQLNIDETDSDDTPRSYTITETDDGEEENLPISKNEEMPDEESDESIESNNVEETETTKVFEEIIRMDLKRMGYDVEITEIERIRKFGVTAKIITTYEFMKKYLTIWNLEDGKLDEQILQWRVENTKECGRCEIERLKREFEIGKETCIECEKDIEKENPTDDEDEMEEDIKGPEIGSSKKPKSKEKNKKSKEVPIIPITPVPPIKPKITMAASRDELRADLRALMNTMYNHDIGADWNNLAVPPITLTGLQGEVQANTNAIGNLNANRGAIVEIPAFYGTSGEDPEEWADKFEETFTANGLGNDDAQRFRLAKAKLMGGAADWLKTEGVNIVDWNVNGDHNLRLRVRIIGKYASDEIKDRWLEQLEKIRQGDENVTQYLTRFKYMLKRAGGDAAVAANQQKRIFIRGLKPDFTKDVVMGNPADLNATFQIAKNVERGLEALTDKVQPKGINDEQRRQEPIVQGNVRNNKGVGVDELADSFAKLQIKMLEDENERLRNLASQSYRRLPQRNQPMQRNQPIQRNQSFQKRVPTCYTCGRAGHYSGECPEKRRNVGVNMMDEYYDQEEYDYNGYEDEEPQHGEMYYTQGYYDDYEDRELNYHNELYAKDNAVKTRRQTRRTNPVVGYKNNGEEGNLQEELREAGNRMDDREIPSGTTTPRYTPERIEQNNVYKDSQNWDNPIGPEDYNYGRRPMTKDGRFYKPMFTKEGKAFYPGMRQDEFGNWVRTKPSGTGKPREYGLRLTDGIPPYDIVEDVKNCRANITIGQMINENTKYHKQLREGTYRPRSINEKN